MKLLLKIPDDQALWNVRWRPAQKYELELSDLFVIVWFMWVNPWYLWYRFHFCDLLNQVWYDHTENLSAIFLQTETVQSVRTCSEYRYVRELFFRGSYPSSLLISIHVVQSGSSILIWWTCERPLKMLANIMLLDLIVSRF